MRIFLDTCVVYPSILRSILLDFASAGHFVPLASERVISEWSHVAKRKGEGPEAEIEISLFRSKWKNSIIETCPMIADCTLPDPDDLHVLEAAVGGQANAILTANNQDFPTRILTRYNLLRRNPDEFLLEFFHENQSHGMDILLKNLEVVQSKHGSVILLPQLLKRMRLSRLRKAILAN